MFTYSSSNIDKRGHRQYDTDDEVVATTSNIRPTIRIRWLVVYVGYMVVPAPGAHGHKPSRQK